MEKIIKFLNGKKAYIVAILIGIGAIAMSLGVVIPEWVWLLLGGLGLGAVRLALAKLKP